MRLFTIVHTESSLGWGGQEIRIFTEMKAMRSRGHRLLLAARPASKIFQRAQEEGFEVYSFNQNSLLFPFTILRLAGWFLKVKPDVVNTHSSKDGWLGGIASRIAGVRCLIRSKHIDVDYPRKFSSRIAYGTLPHHVTTTSEKIREKISRELSIDPGKISCVPTGIDPVPYETASDPGLRESLGIPPDCRVAGMISVIRSWKGHRFFLEAAASLIPENPGLYFVITGDGPGYEALRETVKEPRFAGRVFCLGHRDDVPQLLKAYNLLVLPSTAHEGVPQIILQAQLAGCPVVATRAGGIPEVVEDGKTGLLVPPSDSGALAVAMSRMLAMGEKSRVLTDAARARALQENVMAVMCARSEAIYHALL